MTKSAPGTARKLEWTKVSSRSNTKHFFPLSSGCRAPNNLIRLLSSESSVWFEVKYFSESVGKKQQHISLILSTIVTQVSSIISFPSLSSSFSSSDSLPSLVMCRWGLGPVGWIFRAPSMACADRGVVAFPLASVCVIKSGIVVPSCGSLAACFDKGVLGMPGDRKSRPPRNPWGTLAAGGARCSSSSSLLRVS